MTAGPDRVVLADLHVHLGRASGRPVKITASPSLDLEAALTEAAANKGIEVIGLVDCCTGPVLDAVSRQLDSGGLSPAGGGGLLWAGPAGDGGPGKLLVVPGCEVELVAAGRPVHFLGYLPGVREAGLLKVWLAGYVRNPDLGCQRAHGLGPVEFVRAVRALGGVAGLAHAFTPHRGFYGSTETTLRALLGLDANEAVDFVEMGLSADTAMADLLSELSGTPLIASSDAHSEVAIAREATALRVGGLGYDELVPALRGQKGRGIAATYGLDPRLGKYHRSACPRCGWRAASDEEPRPFLSCPRCGPGGPFVTGVLDRLLAIADRTPEQAAALPRPPYHRHVPLAFLPGIGPAARRRLLEAFGSEIAVLHDVQPEAIAGTAGARAAATIVAARRGELAISPGAGGLYGKVGRPGG